MQNHPHNINFNSKYAHFSSENGILICEFKPEIIIDLKVVSIIESARKELSKGEEWPTLYIISDDYLLLDNQAIRYLSSDDAMEFSSSKAIVFKSSLRRLLINLEFMFLQPSKQFRMFTSVRDAELWLFSNMKRVEGFHQLFNNQLPL